MSGSPDRGRDKVPPYLIVGGSDGRYSLTLRETKLNSQNYPVVVATALDETFGTAAAARAFAKIEFGAVAGEFEIQRGTVQGSDDDQPAG